jgi:hypothetical protein
MNTQHPTPHWPTATSTAVMHPADPITFLPGRIIVKPAEQGRLLDPLLDFTLPLWVPLLIIVAGMLAMHSLGRVQERSTIKNMERRARRARLQSMFLKV